MIPEALFRRLTELLRQNGIPHMLTGSFASAFYGVPRGTQDVDLVITATPEQLRSFVASLPRDEYYVDEAAALDALRDGTQFNAIDRVEGWKIDFIFRKRRPFSETEFERRRPGAISGIPIDVVTPEDLVLAKLEWAKLGESRRQIDDAAGILELFSTRLDWDYLEQWADSLSLWKQLKAARKSAGLEPE